MPSHSLTNPNPTLTPGTIRSNLDPFGRYEDGALWEALRKASLEAPLRASPQGLDSPVAEYGENLSQVRLLKEGLRMRMLVLRPGSRVWPESGSVFEPNVVLAGHRSTPFS